MALRLTGTSLATERPLAPAELAARATTLLGAADTGRYLALFDQASALADIHERHHARVLLVERGLAATASPPPAEATRLFVAVAQALVPMLEDEPREPILLNYAGVAFYELWALDAARALFTAAGRLDHALPHLRRNLAEVGRRLRSGRGPAAQLRPLHTAVPALARRAKRLAAGARPATGQTLSLCMIVRDEEEMLPRCLAAAAPAVDEIVIIDTGSTDTTVDIARSFGARVIERPWTGSFAEARNVSFDAATGDWIIYLDADEVLVSDDVKRLRALTGQVWREAFYLLETSYTGEDGEGTGITHPSLRVFRNRPEYRFEGRLHEQIAHRLPMHVAGRVEQSAVRVEHYGYLGSVRDAKEKSRRNIELLKVQQSEGQSNAFLYFNLGSEYAAIGDAAAAAAEFDRAWRLVRGQGGERYDYVPTLASRLVSALRDCGRADEALATVEEGLALFPGFTDLVYGQGLTLAHLGRTDEALAAWQRCLEMGDAPARYGATVGAGTFLPMLAMADARLRRGETDAARTLLEDSMERYPRFLGGVAPYATLLLRSGVPAEEVVTRLERALDALTPTARFMLASALERHGAYEAAAHQYRAVLKSRPRSSQVRLTLAETLLRRGTYGEAAELVDAIETDDPYATQAARIGLWATTAGHRLDDLAAARERARRAGVSAAELEVFAQWTALARGETPERALGIAGTPLLGVILETLLALHEFDTFERLIGVLHASALPAREQRELLGAMYLRYGFLQSAAREWMAVCQERPDARALLGLARVAAAHGLPDDARTFAEQALALDPACHGAREVLAA